MHQPSFRGVVAALSRRLPRPGLGIAIFGARVLVAFAFPPLVFAHEAQPAAPRRRQLPSTKLRSGKRTRPR